MDFVASVNADTDVDEAWEAYVKQRKQDDLNEIITSENLKADETTKFVENAFKGCSGLTSISVDVNNPKYDSRNNCNAIIETETNILIAGCKNTIIPDSDLLGRFFCTFFGLVLVSFWLVLGEW